MTDIKQFIWLKGPVPYLMIIILIWFVIVIRVMNRMKENRLTVEQPDKMLKGFCIKQAFILRERHHS